jgi:hypothetical protein
MIWLFAFLSVPNCVDMASDIKINSLSKDS